MPVRLLFTIAVAAFAAIFTGLNLDYKCDVWLFHHFENVPIAASIFISFLAGVLVVLPFTIGKTKKIEVPVEKIVEKVPKLSREEKRKLKKEKKAKAQEKENQEKNEIAVNEDSSVQNGESL